MADSPLLYFAEEMILHDPGAGHPERPDRLRALREALERLEDMVDARTAKLEADLADARAQNDALQDVTDQVAKRLDAAISRLKTMTEA